MKLWPLCTSIMHIGMKAHHALYRIGSRLAQCSPFETARNALITMSTNGQGSSHVGVGLLGAGKKPSWVVLDNAQMYHRRRDQRIGTKNRLIIGTGATEIQMEDCSPDDLDLDALTERIRQGLRRNLSAREILDSVQTAHLDTVFCFHFATALVGYVPALRAPYEAELSKLFAEKTRKHQINPKRLTVIRPLGTNSANETTTKGMWTALTDFLAQLGITASTYSRRLMFFSGDGKSFETMSTVRRYLSGSQRSQKGDFDALRFLCPVLEIWHTRWTELSRICRKFWGGSHSHTDPSSLGYFADAVNSPKPSDFTSVDYHANARLVDVVVRGQILHCWE